QRQVAASVATVKSAGAKSVEGKKALDKITKLVDKFKAQADKLEKSLDQSSASAEKHAKHFRDGVIPNMTALRELGDELENMMPPSRATSITRCRSSRRARCPTSATG